MEKCRGAGSNDQSVSMGMLYNRKPAPDSWRPPLERWLDSLRAQGHRPATIDTRRRHLEYFARQNASLSPDELTRSHILAWAAKQDWRPETRHSYYNSFTSFLRWFGDTVGNLEPIHLPTVRRPRSLARPVPEGLVQAVMDSSDPRIALGARLAASAGLRRSEIAAVHVNDFLDDLTGRSILVNGKGGATRYVPLADGLDEVLRRHVRDNELTGYLFPGGSNGHIGSAWIGKLINRQLPMPWTLHGLRHRFATTIYQRTGNLIVVQQLLGHESVATTQRYLAYDPEQLRGAVNLADAA